MREMCGIPEIGVPRCLGYRNPYTTEYYLDGRLNELIQKFKFFNAHVHCEIIRDNIEVCTLFQKVCYCKQVPFCCAREEQRPCLLIYPQCKQSRFDRGGLQLVFLQQFCKYCCCSPYLLNFF